MLVGLDITDEYQGVVVLDLLHGRLSGQRVLDDVVSIHAEEKERSHSLSPGAHSVNQVIFFFHFQSECEQQIWGMNQSKS